MSLSNDEMSVLMIAAQGQTMLPIGRWEEPTKSLAAKGFMKCEIHCRRPPVHDHGSWPRGYGKRR